MSEKMIGKMMGTLENEEAFNEVVAGMQSAANAAANETESLSNETEKEEKTENLQEIDPVDREFTEKREIHKRQYSEIELEALKKGWRPEEEYTGDPQNFRSAQEYLGRSELYEKIAGQNRAIKNLESSMKELTELNRRQHEMLMKERADYFLQQKRAAIENGNITEAEKFEEAYYNTNQNLGVPPTSKIPATYEPHPAAIEFARRNVNWFNEDTPENIIMKEYAIKKEEYLQKIYPEWSDEKRLIETERAVKDFFSHRFKNVERQKPSRVAIAENTNYSTTPAKFTFDQLPAKYKPMVARMAKATGLGLDEYAQQLREMGEV